MKTTAIREKLHEYVDQGDDKLLKLLYALAKEYTEDDELHELNDEELAILEERREDRLAGKSKTYNWEEVKGRLLSV